MKPGIAWNREIVGRHESYEPFTLPNLAKLTHLKKYTFIPIPLEELIA